ncbi:hypothetical protein Taro_027038 [Colocasia esculenta]|uniref:Uncharacterized protein n=1 Tax=Colocasia esculenta TaxID=4460 RepID=A0A843VQG3_COLES|nr:hypothetical protein [Colocasia esculenta]
MVECRPVRTSRDVMSRRSNRPQHHEALYFPHCRLWITEYSCKVWYKPCRRRLIPRQHSRHSWRPRSDFQELDPAISHDKRIAGAKEEASPMFLCCGDHPGARRKKI